MKYPAVFKPESGGFVVTFRDIPEAITQGDDDADALFMARDVLREAMSIYFDEKRPVPMPSKPHKGERLVDLPASVAVKVLLLNEVLAQKIGPSEMGRRLGMSPQTANRLIDLSHATKIDQLEDALNALGKDLELSVVG